MFTQLARASGSESMQLMYLLAIAAAERSHRLANAYFVPDEPGGATMLSRPREARRARCGSSCPGRTSTRSWCARASRAIWGPLLEAGVEIYEYQPTMFHCKVLVVDDCGRRSARPTSTTAPSGSTTRRTSTCYDPAFAGEQMRVFDDDRGRSRQVTLEAWRHRPLWERVRERWALVFRSQI